MQPLKDFLGKEYISSLADELKKNYKSFDKDTFKNSFTSPHWDEKTLKERIRYIAEQIHVFLPTEFKNQVRIIKLIAPKFSGLQGLVFPDFVQTFGLDNYEISIEALEFLTPHSTSEFAIRPFIEKYPKKSIKTIHEWSASNNYHVRRLASEGSRPKLPWAKPLTEFIKNPELCLEILENLKNDDSLYVRKSVANHLNDISKNHPELVLKLCKNWYGSSQNTNWIVKHSLRTLLKKGNREALSIFDTSDTENIEIDKFRLLKSKLKIGDTFQFEFCLSNSSSFNKTIRLEYIIHYVKSIGKTSPKIFKISESIIQAQSSKKYSKSHSFADLSTRKHYKGKHKLTLVVNGEQKVVEFFELT